MIKTTLYLPSELEARLEAESASTGVSKAELMRQGIAMRLKKSIRSVRKRALPVFGSGSSLSVDQMDALIAERIEERAERR